MLEPHDGAWRSVAVAAATAAAAAASSPRYTVGTQCPSIQKPLPPVRPAPRHAVHRTRQCSRVTVMMTMMTMSMTGQWQWYDTHSRKYCPELSAQASAVAALAHAHTRTTASQDTFSSFILLPHPPAPLPPLHRDARNEDEHHDADHEGRCLAALMRSSPNARRSGLDSSSARGNMRLASQCASRVSLHRRIRFLGAACGPTWGMHPHHSTNTPHSRRCSACTGR